MWKYRIKTSDTGWHQSQTFRARFCEHWWDRFRLCRNQFVYDLTIPVPMSVNGEVLFSYLEIDGHRPWQWLWDNPRGRIALVINVVEHTTSASIRRAAGIDPPMRVMITVAFSDKKLAMLWKLTWGGKMVDGRKMSLRLAI